MVGEHDCGRTDPKLNRNLLIYIKIYSTLKLKPKSILKYLSVFVIDFLFRIYSFEK